MIYRIHSKWRGFDSAANDFTHTTKIFKKSSDLTETERESIDLEICWCDPLATRRSGVVITPHPFTIYRIPRDVWLWPFSTKKSQKSSERSVWERERVEIWKNAFLLSKHCSWFITSGWSMFTIYRIRHNFVTCDSADHKSSKIFRERERERKRE